MAMAPKPVGANHKCSRGSYAVLDIAVSAVWLNEEHLARICSLMQSSRVEPAHWQHPFLRHQFALSDLPGVLWREPNHEQEGVRYSPPRNHF